MTQDALLHEANRTAHELAKAAKAFRDAPGTKAVGREAVMAWCAVLERIAKYEEAERRAQMEATG